jgi:hypothetical protein
VDRSLLLEEFLKRLTVPYRIAVPHTSRPNPSSAYSLAEFLASIGRSDAPFLISSTIFGGGRYLALLANGKGFIGLETGFDHGDVLAGVGLGLRHQVHADHAAARDDDANEIAWLGYS